MSSGAASVATLVPAQDEFPVGSIPPLEPAPEKITPLLSPAAPFDAPLPLRPLPEPSSFFDEHAIPTAIGNIAREARSIRRMGHLQSLRASARTDGKEPGSPKPRTNTTFAASVRHRY